MAVKRKTGVSSITPLPQDNLKDNMDIEQADDILVPDEADDVDTETGDKSLDKDDDNSDKLPVVEDDLPLGSEANTMTPEFYGYKKGTAVDKRLTMLREQFGGSFESNCSSGSSNSIASLNSVEMLLRERSEDPEQVLLNLGFGGTQADVGNSMSRIPERFLMKNSHAKGIHIEEFLQDNPELKTFVGTLKKKGSRSGAWKAARSMSTTLRYLKMSVAGKQKTMSIASSPVIQDNWPRSILIPENQHALELQGFYTQYSGVKNKSSIAPGSGKPLLIEEKFKSLKDAATRRRIFQKSHSKTRDLIIETPETYEPHSDSSASFDYSRSMEYSTSMDSMDSLFSPEFIMEDNQNHIETKMEDAIFKLSSTSDDKTGISQVQKKEMHSLFAELGNSGDTPSVSKQSTVERVRTLSSSSIQESPLDKIKIVVSVESDDVFASASDKVEQKAESENLTMLNVASFSSDRLSDTSSDYTVVDKHSVTSLDSPEVSGNQQSTPEFPPLLQSFTEKEAQETAFVHSPDENDNFPMFKFSKSPVITDSPSTRIPCLHGDDLSRMGSVQSDSSGFGDTDNSADVTTHETDVPRFSNPGSLGSSSESAATLASSVSTILARELLEKDNSLQMSLDYREAEENNMPVFSWKKIVRPDISNKEGYLSSDSTKETFISMCYIPISGKTKQSKQSKVSSSHRPEIKQTNNNVAIIVTREPSIEHKEERTSEVRQSMQKNRQFGAPDRDTLHPEYVSPFSPSTSNCFAYNSTPEISQSWLKSGSRRAQFFRSRFNFGSGDSILSESDFSYCSTPESIASSVQGEMMDYSKLIKLINQPVSVQGYKRSIIQYKPKKHVKEWSNLIRKKRLQEETNMLQYAVQKYKTELHSLETAFIVQFQQAYEELSDEDRDEVEELQHIWTAIHQQLLETERLLSQRMKKINCGNDFFTYISALNVLNKMILLLREQLYQQQITVGKDEIDLINQVPSFPPRSYSNSGLDVQSLPVSPSLHGLNPRMPAKLGQSLDELRESIIKDVHNEVKKSTQDLHLDIRTKENEIQRLKLELLMEKFEQSQRLHRQTVEETDV